MTATQWCNDGLHEWLPAVNCLTCGRFIGKDGVVEIGYFEMSSEIAYVEGECARCLSAAVPESSEQA